MENNKKNIINWALSEFENNIQIYEQAWPLISNFNYFDYKTEIKINGATYTGRGVKNLKALAVNVSIAESIERFALSYANIKDSNGCAIHIDKIQAKNNARNELLERHYVMLFTLGYYNGEDFKKENIPDHIIRLLEILEGYNINIKFYILLNSLLEKVVLCQASGLKSDLRFGLIFGSSCKKDLIECLEGSLSEVLPNLMAFRLGKIKDANFKNFSDNKNPGPQDHLGLYLNPTFAEEYLKNRKLVRSSNIYIDPGLYTYEFIDYPYNKLLPVVQAKHPQCLQVRWGIIKNSELINHNLNFPFILP